MLNVRQVVTVAVCLIAAYAAGQSYITARNLGASLHAQTVNRTRNVAEWCSAINSIEAKLTGYVAFFARVHSGIPTLALRQLPCAALERKTLASTK